MKDTSRTSHAISNSIWGIASKLMAMIFPFFFRAIIINKIGAAYVGLNGLFSSILNVLNMTELGFGSSIVFMMYKPIAEGNVAEVRQLLNLIKGIYRKVGLVILIAGCCVYPILHLLIKNDTGTDINIYALYSMYLFHTVLSYFMFSYRASIFTAQQRSDIVSKITMACEFAMYIIQAAILFLTSNYYLYLLVYAIMIIPQNLMYYYVSKRLFPDIYCEGIPTKEQVNTLKGKILPLMGHRIGGKVIVSIDDIIISSFLGITALTIYDNYYYIFHAIVLLLSVIRNSIMASLGNKLYSDSIDSMYVTYKRVAFTWFIVVGWCAACMAGLYQPFIRLWVGDAYVYPTETMLSIVLYFFLWQFRYVGVTMKDAAGMWEPDKLKPYIGMVVNFLGSILFVKLTGSVLGVLYPTMFVMLFIYFPWETWILFKKLFRRNSKEYLMMALRCFITSIVATFASLMVGNLIGEGSILRFLLRVICCTCIAAFILIGTNWNTPELKSSYGVIKKKLASKHRAI